MLLRGEEIFIISAGNFCLKIPILRPSEGSAQGHIFISYVQAVFDAI